MPRPAARPGLAGPGPDPGQRPGPDAMPDLSRERRRQEGLLREDQDVLRRKGQVPGELPETSDHRLRLERPDHLWIVVVLHFFLYIIETCDYFVF